MMKTPLVVISLLLVAAFLVAGSVAPGGVGRPAAVQAAGLELAAGGRYHLTGGCQIQQVASGGRYRLWAPAIPAQSTGNPCCCVRVPAVIRGN